MRRPSPTLALGALLLASASAGAAEVRLQVNGSDVDLDARAAPLTEVLDHLARATGMKLVFDGVTPRSLVTISLHGRSPTETVLALLEGTGINFALISDPTGVRVETLRLTGTAPPSSSAPRGRAPVRPSRSLPVAPDPIEEPPVDDEPPPDEPDLPNDAGTAGPPPEEAAPAEPMAPAPASTPPPYGPGPFLPSAPNAVQPLQPFPAPAPNAPPQNP